MPPTLPLFSLNDVLPSTFSAVWFSGIPGARSQNNFPSKIKCKIKCCTLRKHVVMDQCRSTVIAVIPADILSLFF